MNTSLVRFFELLLFVFWEPFSKKRAYFFHWINFSKLHIDDNEVVKVQPDKNVKPRDSFLAMFWQTNIAWRRVVVIEPTEDCHTVKSFKVGYSSSIEGRQQLCQICFTFGTKIGFLCGPDSFVVYMIDQDGNQVPCREVGYYDKYRLPKDVFLV